jgi:hypothetical protein
VQDKIALRVVQNAHISLDGVLSTLMASAARALPARLDLALGGCLVHPGSCLHFFAGL